LDTGKSYHSKILISDITEYFKKHHGIDISNDEAFLYLDSLSDLFLAFSGLDLNDYPVSSPLGDDTG